MTNLHMGVIKAPLCNNYTYCLPSKDSARILSCQELPTSIEYGEAMPRRRKEERRAGIASRGMGRQLSHCSSRVRHRGVPDRERVPDRCNPRSQLWPSAVTLPHEHNGLNTRRMTVL